MHLSDLVDAILDAGLLQFGAFQHADASSSYRLHLSMLPSYPAVLAQTSNAVATLIDGQPSRLVCTEDAISLATLVSQTLSIPLVVHSGRLGHPAHNLVGAYDVGHSAALISLTTQQDSAFIKRLVAEAAGVGLNITQWVSLIGLQPINEIRHAAVLNLRDMADVLVERGEVSAQMASHILNDA
jgi:hypothetical protein